MTEPEPTNNPKEHDTSHINKLIGEALLRTVWEEFQNPSGGPKAFNDRIYERYDLLLRAFHERRVAAMAIANDFPSEAAVLAGVLLDTLVRRSNYGGMYPLFAGAAQSTDFLTLMDALESAENKDKAINQGGWGAFFEAWNSWKPRVVTLTPTLVASVKEVYSEYIQWLSRHPDALNKIAWEAFEKLIAEVMASNGFQVELVGRRKDERGDIVAIKGEEGGREIKYIIECKRYSPDRHVGIDIVERLLGAAIAKKTDHAMLVTTTTFTKDVLALKTRYEELNLHLHDGSAVVEWLRGYTHHKRGGLWVAQGWDKTF